MRTAKEASEASNRFFEEEYRGELTFIELKIEYAIEHGLRRCSYKERISRYCRSKLVNLGYAVMESDEDRDPLTTINW